jgi:hypothetical protein
MFQIVKNQNIKKSEKGFFGALILSFNKSEMKICRFFLSAVAFAPIRAMKSTFS